MTPVDTSAEAVERWIGCAEAFDARSDYGNGLLDRAAGLLRALDTERADLVAWRKDAGDTLVIMAGRIGELESLLAARNVQSAAAFTASDAYQKRCEQGDALLKRASKYVTEAAGACAVAESLELAIDAHLAGEGK
jgi:hypothetical protein